MYFLNFQVLIKTIVTANNQFTDFTHAIFRKLHQFSIDSKKLHLLRFYLGGSQSPNQLIN